MKKLNFLLLISVVTLFLLCPSFSNAQRSGRKAKTTSSKIMTKPKTTPVANQPNKSTSVEKPNVILIPTSFSAKGLYNEKLMTNLYLGDFVDIPFDRDNIDFSILYEAYLTSYARRCDAHLPRNKVEMTYQSCDTWR